MRKRLYVVGHALAYWRPFGPLFSVAESLDEAEVAMFTGGSDVTPALYGEPNVYSGNDYARDQHESEMFAQFRKRGIPMLGICRGAQFLTVMNGGKLYQDVHGHAIGGTHDIRTDDGQILPITSTHHQMMRPAGNFRIVAWTPHRSKWYKTGLAPDNQVPELEVDPEIVFYPDTRCLAIQGHPELMDTNSPTCTWLRDLAAQTLGV